MWRVDGVSRNNNLGGSWWKSYYFSKDLEPLVKRFDQRLLFFLAHGFLVVLTGFISMRVYGLWRHWPVALSFQGMYAWHSALNFTVSLILVMEGWRLIRNRNVFSAPFRLSTLWLLGTLSFVLAYAIQRTLVYAAVACYDPALIRYYENFACQRPGFWGMCLWCFCFWLPMFGITTIIAMWQVGKARKEAPVSPTESQQRWVLEDGKHVFSLSRVTHISMEDHYARIHWVEEDGKEALTLIRMTMKQMLAQLPNDLFCQVHRSHLVNLTAVRGLQRQGRSWVVNLGSQTIPVSRNRVPSLREKLSKSFS
jgi:hypothetical protein